MGYDWKLEMESAMSGRGDWFSAKLLRLIAKADWQNKERLRKGFPEHVAAYERWYRCEGEFADQVGS